MLLYNQFVALPYIQRNHKLCKNFLRMRFSCFYPNSSKIKTLNKTFFGFGDVKVKKLRKLKDKSIAKVEDWCHLNEVSLLLFDSIKGSLTLLDIE